MARWNSLLRSAAVAGLAAAVGVGITACDIVPAEQQGMGSMDEAPMDPETRGQYLVSISGCNDCHTPGYFFGMPDFSRQLAGAEVGFFMPGMGYFYGPNLTPDEATGLGTWSEDQIVTALRTGVRPDGRVLAPIMPWMGLANLTDEDAFAIAAFLKSLPAISNQVAPPTAADRPAPGPYMAIVVPEAAPPAP